MQVLLVYRPESAGDLDDRHIDHPFDGVEVYGLYPDDAELGGMTAQLRQANPTWQFRIERGRAPAPE
jgi:hypothetical protein